MLERQAELIMRADTCEDVLKTFENGCTLWYDPAVFIKELEESISKLFIE